jgi:hypothetical protein
MRHLRCLCFVRPSPESIQGLIEELREPKYSEYNICEDYAEAVLLEPADPRQTSATPSKSRHWSDWPRRTTTKSCVRCRSSTPTS